MTWERQIVDCLANLREAEGHDFPRHWDMAMRLYPPRNWGMGNSSPRLFEEDGRAPDTLLAFFQRACEDAYYDRGANQEHTMPRVRFFRPEMLRDLDSSAPARRAVGSRSRFRQAA